MAGVTTLEAADVVARPPATTLEAVIDARARRGLHMPAANVLPPSTVRALLEAAGFEVTTFVDLAPRVFKPFRSWFLRQPLRQLLRYDPGFMLVTAAWFLVDWHSLQVVATKR
jgi:hypothetical protein